jgi:hypothetical protein
MSYPISLQYCLIGISHDNNQYIINNNTIWMTNKDQPNKPIISPDSKAPLEEENDLGVFQTMANGLKLI